ncbi:MAG: VCBS repeat-containing protein [Phycisphaerales bacterium]|nr:VCBS repeat-containing protein [Phycisphaerales bacterium]
MPHPYAISPVVMFMLCGSAVATDWIRFEEQTSTRFAADPAVSTTDTEQKRYAWADLDNDGDTDLVCVRAEPALAGGKRTNVLLMNESGVLTDRTALYAAASDVPGDNGFLTPTCDADVAIVDVNADGWPDIVTSTVLSQGDLKHISHPRIYINLGNDGSGDWQGLRYEDARIPQLDPTNAPQFIAIAPGDFDADGDTDLFFCDTDSLPQMTQNIGNRVLLNSGSGMFSDQTPTILTTTEMRSSARAVDAVAADFNQDGIDDIAIVRTFLARRVNSYESDAQTTTGLTKLGIYPLVFYPTAVTAGDLNNDAKPDTYICDTPGFGLLNTGVGTNGLVTWSSTPLANVQGLFAVNPHIVDLDNDGWNDVVEAGIFAFSTDSCSNPNGARARLIQNTTLSTGGILSLTEHINESDLTVAGIPLTSLEKTHEIAILDINSDGMKDLVIGRCDSTEVWIQIPVFDAQFTLASDPPNLLEPDTPTVLQIDIAPRNTTITRGTAAIRYSINGAPDVVSPLSPLGGDTYEATLPALTCGDTIEFAFEVQLDGAGLFSFPEPPAVRFSAISAALADSEIQGFETNADGWTITNESLTFGAWERVIPVGTINSGIAAAPNAAASGQWAFVTMNGAPGGAASASDVDGGPTILTSPVFDLSGKDARVSYSRWFYCNQQGQTGADELVTEVSNNDGQSWVVVHAIDGTNAFPGTEPDWEQAVFVVSDFVTPTDQVRVRFRTQDQPNSSVTEAGIDSVVITTLACTPPLCLGDFTGDHAVNMSDLDAVLSGWDAPYTVDDLNAVLSNWQLACQ